MAIAQLNAPEQTKRALSIAFVKNPNDPRLGEGSRPPLYRRIMRSTPGREACDVYHWYGMTVAWTMVDTLKRAGRNLTRSSLLRAAQTLRTDGNPFLLPGIRLQTSPSDTTRSKASISTASTMRNG